MYSPGKPAIRLCTTMSCIFSTKPTRRPGMCSTSCLKRAGIHCTLNSRAKSPRNTRSSRATRVSSPRSSELRPTNRAGCTNQDSSKQQRGCCAASLHLHVLFHNGLNALYYCSHTETEVFRNLLPGAAGAEAIQAVDLYLAPRIDGIPACGHTQLNGQGGYVLRHYLAPVSFIPFQEEGPVGNGNNTYSQTW